MEVSKANRIFWVLIELAAIADGIDTEMAKHHNGAWHTISPYFNRLNVLRKRPEYQEMRDWLKGKS